MSIFDNLRTLSFPIGVGAKRHDELIGFCERDDRQFVLLTDIWRLGAMGGDRASVVGAYVAASGAEASQHFIFKGTPPKDALLSKAVALKMVEESLVSTPSEFFQQYPINWIFEEAHRAFHGPAIIRGIFDRFDAAAHTVPNFVGLQLEIHNVAEAMLTQWGHRRNGFPVLDRGQAAFLRRLTMRRSDYRRAVRTRDAAMGFFEFNAQHVFEKIQRQADVATLLQS